MKKYKPVLIKQQDETDCAAACIASIAKFYGKRISIARIRTLAKTDKKGTSAKGIQKCAEELGFSCKVIVSSNKKIINDCPFPVIAHIFKNNLEHYVLIYKIKKHKILIADPAASIEWINTDDFYQWWTGRIISLLPNDSFEFTIETKNFLERFWYLLSRDKTLTAEILISSFILTLLGILSAFYFRFLIDEVIYSYLPMALVSISLGYLLMIIFQSILNFCRYQLINYLGNKIEASLILQYFNHILHLPLDFFTSRKNGEILSRFGDITIIKNALSGMSIGVILDCIMLFFVGIVLFTFSSSLVIIAIIPVFFSAILVLLFAKKFRKRIYQKSVIEAEKYSHFVESINGIATIKALCTENNAYDKAEIKVIDSIKKGFSLNNLSNFQGTLQLFLSQTGNLAVYWYGSWLIMQGKLSLGELISFVTLLGYFINPLSRLITLQPQLQELSVSAKRLGEILDLQKEDSINDGEIIPQDIKGNITIKNLSFSYGTRGITLNNISLDINEGEKVAFVGPSGSGKTTLIKLMLKFYQQYHGDIILDGQNIKDLNTKEYRKNFGYVPQEILLFSGSIKDNIAWGNDDISPEDIYNAAKNADALDFISKLENRFATTIGEKGTSLSGGERQRIALSRILLRKPKILILDEATSNLDSISENSIIRTINKISKDSTVIIVAHRLSTIKNCDKIFVLDKGHLVESGNHSTLINNKSLYAKMWETQNSLIDCNNGENE
ncbi:MAG: peptidase domain-containing ABC transporter [Treponema sp.]|nr:peptidase domain-containing ABC transporter [Treponema sp.]